MVKLKQHNSKILDYAERRLRAIKSVNPNLDFGDGINVKAAEKLLKGTRDRIDNYNAAAVTANELAEGITEDEKALEDLIDRLSSGVSVTKGKDSPEFQVVNSIKKTPPPKKRKKDDSPTPPNTPPNTPPKQPTAGNPLTVA